MYFVDLEEVFDRVPRYVLEWALRKKGIPEIVVRSVMSLYEGAKTRDRMDSELSEEFEVKVGMHQGSVMSPFLSTLVEDVVTEFAIQGALAELLYAGLALMSETMECLRDKFLKWKEDFESKGLKVNLGKTKIMVSGSITKHGMPKSKVDPCGVCCLRVKANSALCLQCSKWIHCRCAGVKSVTPDVSRNFTCKKCGRNIGEAVEQEEQLCDEVETLREFPYLGDRVGAGGGCEAAVTAGTR